MRTVSIIFAIIIPAMFLFTIILGVIKRVNIYDCFVSGAKESMNTILNIFPPVITLMIAIGFFRTSGLLEYITSFLTPFFNMINVPPEILPVAILKPMSGSGGLAMLTDIIKTYGADSKIGVISSVICGSTETTFYTIAVYFGSIGITNTRHTVKCALIADFVCVIVGILICSLLLF